MGTHRSVQGLVYHGQAHYPSENILDISKFMSVLTSTILSNIPVAPLSGFPETSSGYVFVLFWTVVVEACSSFYVAVDVHNCQGMNRRRPSKASRRHP